MEREPRPTSAVRLATVLVDERVHHPIHGGVVAVLDLLSGACDFSHGSKNHHRVSNTSEARARFDPDVGANMGEVIQFIPKSELERIRLIRQARALYDSIFPPADPASELRDKTSATDAISGGNAYRSDGGLS